MAPVVVATLAQAVLGAMLLWVGTWSRTRVERLVPVYVKSDDRGRRIRALTRGSLACQVIGVLMLLTVVASLLAP